MASETTYDSVVVVDDADIRADLRDFGKAWWIFLITGFLWIFLSLLVLQFDQTSINTIAVFVGIVLLLASAEEFFHAFLMPGWRWLHAILALLFLLVGIDAFVYQLWTFGALALLIGWFLLFRGTFEVFASLSNRDVDLWWLGLISGIAMILVAFWAVGYPGRSAYLLVVWVGLGVAVPGYQPARARIPSEEARQGGCVMPATKHLNSRSLATAVCGVVAVVGVAGCAGFRVERDGRKTGDAICDIKNASNADDAKAAAAESAEVHRQGGADHGPASQRRRTRYQREPFRSAKARCQRFFGTRPTRHCGHPP